jgi:hypothetical protein
MNPPIDLLTIDPGETSGWSWYHQRVLVRAGYGPFENVIGDRPLAHNPRLKVVIEKPQHRPHEREKDFNDIIALAVMTGEFRRAYILQGCDVELVWPTTWKGSIPKKYHHPQILKRLSPTEVEAIPLRPRAKTADPNCMDAVGMGCWYLGRLR